jgi:hypothetical protein
MSAAPGENADISTSGPLGEMLSRWGGSRPDLDAAPEFTVFSKKTK